MACGVLFCTTRYIILLNMVVPISLYVSIEFIRLGQSVLINFDPAMFDFLTGAYAMYVTTGNTITG